MRRTRPPWSTAMDGSVLCLHCGELHHESTMFLEIISPRVEEWLLGHERRERFRFADAAVCSMSMLNVILQLPKAFACTLYLARDWTNTSLAHLFPHHMHPVLVEILSGF